MTVARFPEKKGYKKSRMFFFAFSHSLYTTAAVRRESKLRLLDLGVIYVYAILARKALHFLCPLLSSAYSGETRVQCKKCPVCFYLAIKILLAATGGERRNKN